jgi:hypothetical protein
MLKRLALAGLCAAICGSAVSSAHHAQSATYQLSDERTIEGTVVRLVFRNPHTFIYLDVAAPGAHARSWALECGTPKQIAANQVDQHLRPGDFIVVTGNPAHDPSTGRLLMKNILRPSDGRRWFRRP